VLTLIVKFCLYPLYAMQIKSTARMSEIQPKMQELQRKYGNDREMLNQKTMELYQAENYNPMSGCLPMIIQMPIILGLFVLLRNPLYYIDAPQMLMAVHESFLWINDLSQPDPWILPIAAGIATFISYAQTTSNTMPNTSGVDMSGMTKGMKYIFPIMILLMGRSFPAGLTIYWCLGQVIQIFFNIRIMKMRKAIMEGTYVDKKRKTTAA
jgi:YidC/Oxa1 family membrane protein insertase